MKMSELVSILMTTIRYSLDFVYFLVKNVVKGAMRLLEVAFQNATKITQKKLDII